MSKYFFVLLCLTLVIGLSFGRISAETTIDRVSFDAIKSIQFKGARLHVTVTINNQNDYKINFKDVDLSCYTESVDNDNENIKIDKRKIIGTERNHRDIVVNAGSKIDETFKLKIEGSPLKTAAHLINCIGNPGSKTAVAYIEGDFQLGKYSNRKGGWSFAKDIGIEWNLKREGQERFLSRSDKDKDEGDAGKDDDNGKGSKIGKDKRGKVEKTKAIYDKNISIKNIEENLNELYLMFKVDSVKFLDEELKDQYEVWLKVIAEFLDRNDDRYIRVVGNASKTGEKKYNLWLSYCRAKRIARMLERYGSGDGNGITDQIVAMGEGYSQCIRCTGGDDTTDVIDRRVTFNFINNKNKLKKMSHDSEKEWKELKNKYKGCRGK